MSHPSRVRELKRLLSAMSNMTLKSHPSRVRELKHCRIGSPRLRFRVAPLAGA